MFHISSRLGASFGAASVLLAVAAPSQAAPTAVKSVVFSTGFKNNPVGPSTPVGVATSFSANTGKIHCTVRLTKLDSRAVVRSVWTVESSPGMAPNAQVYADKIGPMKDLVQAKFSVNGNGQWPVGRYKVNVFLNNKLARVARFTVK